MNPACIEFAKASITEGDIRGKSVIEIGALNVNGSLRPLLSEFHPSSYVGIDLDRGPGVDEVCDAKDIIEHFGCNKFDVLISTEMLEHVKNWKTIISNFKNVLKPSGIMIITTRSKGFPFHGYPYDFWRYETDDMKLIFSDFIIEKMEKDACQPGIFLKARKPENYKENSPSCNLYSIILLRRAHYLEANIAYMAFRILRGLPHKVKNFLFEIYQNKSKNSL